MDLYKLLKQDHDKVSNLFKKISQTSDSAAKTRERLCSELAMELDIHTRAEEEHFYPILKRHEETKDQVSEALREHQEAKQMLQQLEKMDVSEEDFLDMVKELQKAVQHHVREEEGEIFAAAQKVIASDKAQEIADKIMEMKKQERAA